MVCVLILKWGNHLWYPFFKQMHWVWIIYNLGYQSNTKTSHMVTLMLDTFAHAE